MRDLQVEDDEFDVEDVETLEHKLLGNYAIKESVTCMVCLDVPSKRVTEDLRTFACDECMDLWVGFTGVNTYVLAIEGSLRRDSKRDARIFDMDSVEYGILAKLISPTTVPWYYAMEALMESKNLENLMDAEQAPSAKENGYCYLHLFRPAVRAAAKRHFGIFPKCAWLMNDFHLFPLNPYRLECRVKDDIVHFTTVRGGRNAKNRNLLPGYFVLAENLDKRCGGELEEYTVADGGFCWRELFPYVSYDKPEMSMEWFRYYLQKMVDYDDRHPERTEIWCFKFTLENGCYHISGAELYDPDTYVPWVRYSLDKDMYTAKSWFAANFATHKPKPDEPEEVVADEVDSGFDEEEWDNDVLSKDMLEIVAIKRAEEHVNSNEYAVGSLEIVEEALRVHGNDIGKAQAVQLFEDDFKSIDKTAYKLSKADAAEWKRWTGNHIMSRATKKAHGDHILFAVAREQLRDRLMAAIPHNQDGLSHLHIGATSIDWSRWKSHVGHEFYFHCGEDKDIPRIIEDSSTAIKQMLSDMTLPSISLTGKGSTLIRFDGVKDMLKLADLAERKRIHFSMPNARYGVLHFPDSLYDMTPEMFSDYWDKTDAMMGYAIMFFPDKFISEFACESEHYNYKEYVSCTEKMHDLVEQIWPTILLLGPFLPTYFIAESFHNFLHHVVDHMWDRLIDWVNMVKNDDFPLEAAAGIGFEAAKMGPIFNQVMGWIRDLIRAQFTRVSVTWKYGYTNGYDHKLSTWKYWAKNRRIPYSKSINGSRKLVGYIDSEILQRQGEMYLIRFYRSSGTSPIVHQLQLPDYRRPVRILDIANSIDWKTGLVLEKKWISINHDDWWDVLNFCMSETMDSLNHAVLITQISRRRRGLKLGTNVLVDPMSIKSEDMMPFAMAALMEAARCHNVLEAIENNQKLKDTYKMNITKIMERVAKSVVVAATLGLAVPAWMLFKWLVTSTPDLVFVEYVESPPRRIERTKPIGTTGDLLDFPINMVVPNKTLGKKNPCMLCSMAECGKFSKTGKYDDGQFFHCDYVDPVPLDLSFSQADMPNLIAKIRDARTAHVEMGATKVATHIHDLERFLETFQDVGMEFKAEVHYVKGGPGTGKSEVIKVLYKYLSGLAYQVKIVAPFADLVKDYASAETIGYSGLTNFAANTTYYLIGEKRANVLLVDECSGIDWDTVRAMAKYLSVTQIWLFGDKEQTALRPEQAEGHAALHEFSGVDWEKVPTHELVKNYRLGMFRTKWCNDRFGYRMLPVRQDDDRPRLMSISEYENYVKDHPIDREMVFSHNSAQDVFGKVSLAGDKSIDNMSVRSAQGKTFETSAIGITSGMSDEAVSKAHGMLNVANTRSKQSPIWVVHDKVDPYWEDLKIRLAITDTEANRILAAPLPNPPVVSIKTEMTDQERRVNLALREKADNHKVRPLEKNLELIDYTGNVWNDYHVDEIKRKAMEVYKSSFHSCLCDSILEQFPNATDKVLEIYKEVTEAGVTESKQSKSPIMTLIAGYGTDKKFITNLPFWLRAVNKHFGVGIWVLGLGGKRIFKTFLKPSENSLVDENSRDCSQRESIAILIDLKRNHVTTMPKSECIVKVKYPNIVEPIETSALQLFFGEPISRFKFENGAYQYGVYKAGDVNLPMVLLPELDIDIGLYRKANVPEFGDEERRMINEHMSLFSSWVYEEPELSIHGPHLSTPLRMGTDGYKLASAIDPSGAELNNPTLNWGSGAQGQQFDTNVKLRWEGFMFERTAGGSLKRRREKEYFSVMPGMGNHYGKSPEETLLAAQRLGKRAKKPSLTAESRKFAHQIADEYFRAVWKPNFAADPEKVNAVIERAMKDAKIRNYDGRRKAELERSGTYGFDVFKISVFNKDQFKPTKSGKLDLAKMGQPISQDPAYVNLNFITYMRVQYAMQKWANTDDHFFDDFENVLDFRVRMTEAIRQLPAGARYGISDYREFDSQQNLVTQECEKRLKHLTGACSETIEAWYANRGDLPFIMHGVFQGTTGGTKTSGKLDTKGGNSDLSGALSNHVFEGVGPKVVAIKGDDGLRVQVGLTVNESKRKRVKDLLGMTMDCDIADGGEFCGTSVSRAGMYPSVVRLALKTTAKHARDYKHFAEQQVALRDAINEYRALGIEEVINYSAFAENKDPEYVRSCMALINSFAHINKYQWEKVVKRRKSPRNYLPTAVGAVLW